MSQVEFIRNMVGVWGMSPEENEKKKKKARIDDLLMEVDFVPFEQFFDSDSDKLLNEKIEVLTALKEGKTISDIPNFYDVLEKYPKGKDGIATAVLWD